MCARTRIRHSGLIDIPMYDYLFGADLVVADLSTSNQNAIFELGIRHGLRPRTTIIIAEKGFQSPFDVNHIVIRKYEHLGVDIGIDEGEKMRKELTELAQTLQQSQAADSPVYSLLDIDPPKAKANAAAIRSPAPASESSAGDPNTYGALFQIALDAKREDKFDVAKPILQRIYAEQVEAGPDRSGRAAKPRVIQELALATYKLGEKAGADAALQAYAELLDLLRQLDPDNTTDPETLGLWSAVHKRRAEMSERAADDRRSDLDAAIWAAERGFLIRQDHYTGGNLAYLLELRATLSSGDDRTADRVLANRVRRKVVAITEARLKSLPDSDGPVSDINDEIFWNEASHAAALVGLGEARIEETAERIKARAPAEWMAETTLGQIQKLMALREAAGPEDKAPR